MKVSDLINAINIYDVKVVFDDLEKVGENVCSGGIIYFTPVEGKERDKYEKMYRKDEFVSSSSCIHIPNLSIADIIDLYKNCDGTGIYEWTCKTISEQCENIKNIEEAFLIFVFLHEVGHWKQFVGGKCNVKSFVEMDIELEKENFDKMNELEIQRCERINRGNTCKQTAKERKLAEQYMMEYRRIPKEREADKFAMSKIIDSLDLYYTSLEKSKQSI